MIDIHFASQPHSTLPRASAVTVQWYTTPKLRSSSVMVFKHEAIRRSLDESITVFKALLDAQSTNLFISSYPGFFWSRNTKSAAEGLGCYSVFHTDIQERFDLRLNYI